MRKIHISSNISHNRPASTRNERLEKIRFVHQKFLYYETINEKEANIEQRRFTMSIINKICNDVNVRKQIEEDLENDS
jgi:endo-alpha-1,4-polygalactosaminidase (GH114 family)